MSSRMVVLASVLLAAAVIAVPAVSAAPEAQTASAAHGTWVHCANRAGTRYFARARPRSCTHFGPGGAFAGGVNLASLKWSSWGGSSARGTGVERGFHLPYSHIPVKVRAFRPRRTCGRLLYTRLRATSSYGTTTVRIGGCGRST